MALTEKRKLRIGILIDSYRMPIWRKRIFEWMAHSESAEICLIIKNNTKSPTSFWSKIVQSRSVLIYKIHYFLDKLFFKPTPNAFKEFDFRDFFKDISTLAVTPVMGKFTDRIPEEDVEKVKAYDLDIMLRMGFRILKGGILSASKYGIWSYHHGDSHVNRGAPAAYWEIIEKWPETGSILQILTDELDGGKILNRSWTATHPYSIALNRNNLYWKSASVLPRRIKELYELGEAGFFERVEQYNQELEFYDRPLFRAPGNFKALELAWRHFFDLLKQGLYHLFFKEKWLLLFKLDKKGLHTSIRRFKKLRSPQNRNWAEPCVIYSKEHYYVFVKDYKKGKRSVISVLQLNDKGKLIDHQQVLEESYSLSYPYVFSYKEQYYMTPSSPSNGRIDLYECQSFPYKWKYKKTLLHNVNAINPTIIWHDEKWWLFTALDSSGMVDIYDELCIYYSSDLHEGEWTPHPLNPIKFDIKDAKPAGRLFLYNKQLYRPSQDGSRGNRKAGIKIHKVTVLNEKEYQEETVSSIYPEWDKQIQKTGVLSFDEKMTLVDGCYKRIFLV